jgi:hypothetical protein
MYSCKLAAILIAAISVPVKNVEANPTKANDADAGKARNITEPVAAKRNDSVPVNPPIKPPRKSQDKQSSDSEEAKEEHPKPYNFHGIFINPTATVSDLLNLTLIAVTVCLSTIGAIIAWFALRESRRMSDTASKQLRAYVGWAGLTTPPGKTEMMVKNRGNTPAKVMAGIVLSRKTPTTLREILALDIPKEQTGFTLSSSEKYLMRGDRDVEFPCFTYGRIDYTDIFNETHTTAFQFKVIRDGEHLPWTDGNHED